MYQEYYVDGITMKGIDQYAIETMGIPSMVLMERAALALCRFIEENFRKEGRILILAGMGNNGADGLALARMLADLGYEPYVLGIGNPGRATVEWKTQYEIIQKMGLTSMICSSSLKELPDAVKNLILSEENQLLVDGLFGIGLSRAVEGIYLDLIRLVNQSGVKSLAIDIPSGVLAGSGQLAGDAIRCDYTITFGRKKLGCMLYPGAAYCGEVICRDVGFTSQALEQVGYQAWSLGGLNELSGQKKLMRKRPADGHKGTFGRLLVIAGCDSMAGAAVFSASAAMRMGTGLVKVFTPWVNRDVVLNHLPEAILSLYHSEDFHKEQLIQELEWADGVVFGPGLGQGETVTIMLQCLLEYGQTHKEYPIILDADGLRCLAANEFLMTMLTEGVILTPHLGEMADLSKVSVGELKRNQISACQALVDKTGAICIMKQARPVICVPGEKPCIVCSGSNALGTAGSGDVLAGMIGALCAEGYSVREAAWLGAYIHGLAGTVCGRRLGNRSVCASDLMASIGEVMKLLDE